MYNQGLSHIETLKTWNATEIIYSITTNHLGKVSGRPACSELRHIASLTNTVGKRELDFSIMEHFDSDTLGISSFYGLNLQDMNAVGLGTMTGSHITIGLSDSSSNRNIAILAVHVVMTGAGIILQPYSEIFNRAGVLSENLKMYT